MQQEHAPQQRRSRSITLTLPILLALSGLPGCSDAKPVAVPDDGLVVKGGKSLSFDLLKGKIEPLAALDRSIGSFLSKDSEFWDKLKSGNEASIREEHPHYRAALQQIKNSLVLAGNNSVFEPAKRDFQTLVGFVDLLDIKSSPENLFRQGANGAGVDLRMFDEVHDKLRAELIDVLRALGDSRKSLTAVALRALTYETESVFAQTAHGLEQEGRGWLTNDKERHQMLLTTLDRYINSDTLLEVEALTPELKTERAGVREMLVYARSLLSEPTKFPESPDGEDQIAMGAVRSAEQRLTLWHNHLKGYVDTAYPTVKGALAESQQTERPTSHGGGGGAVIVRHHYYYNHFVYGTTHSSYSPTPSINYGGRSYAFAGGKGSYSAPHINTPATGRSAGIVRGGFGSSGGVHVSAGT